MKTIQYKEKTIHFVSIAHVSKASVDEVKEVIETVQPEAVCIELDRNRAYNLQHRDETKDIDIKEVIKSKKVGPFIANLILSSYQKRMADDLGTQVGQEMMQAIESGHEVSASIHYIDRDIQITFNRIWRGMSAWKKANLIATLVGSMFSKDEEIDEGVIEDLKQSDLLYEALKELDEVLPEVSQSILHERNYYMAEKIKRIPYNEIVVVIGAAHTEGIIEALDQTHSIADLNQVPEKKKSYIGWIIPIALILLLVILTLKNPSVGLGQLVVWLGLSAGLATLGAIVAGAHPLTTLTTLVTAPIGTLSPFLAVGFFAGLMEAYQRPPRMSDFDSLSQDVTSVKKWFKNRVLRILLIMILTNLLSSIGTFIAGGSIISKLLG